MNNIKFLVYDSSIQMFSSRYIDHWSNLRGFAGFTTGFGDDPHRFKYLQFTGKHDKNNDEIYEGFILKYESSKYPDHKPYVVRWSEEDCCFECINKDNFMLPSVWKDMEIVGNVIENPDLVEGL